MTSFWSLPTSRTRTCTCSVPQLNTSCMNVANLLQNVRQPSDLNIIIARALVWKEDRRLSDTARARQAITHRQTNNQTTTKNTHRPHLSTEKNSAFSISVASLILLLISRRVCCFKNNSILKWFASSLTSPRHLQVRYYKKMLCLRWKDRLTKLVMHRRCHRWDSVVEYHWEGISDEVGSCVTRSVVQNLLEFYESRITAFSKERRHLWRFWHLYHLFHFKNALASKLFLTHLSLQYVTTFKLLQCYVRPS